jgi:hypothetical protein
MGGMPRNFDIGMDIAEKKRILPCAGLCLKKDIADNGYCFWRSN